MSDDVFNSDLTSVARARVLEAGLRVFAERGFAASKISAIADAAGCSASALYKHFAGKNELYVAVIEDQCARFLAALRTLPPVQDRLADEVDALFRSKFAYVDRHADGVALMIGAVANPAARPNKTVAETVVQATKSALAIYESRLEQAGCEPALSTCRATWFMTVADGLIARWAFERFEGKARPLADHAPAATHLFLACTAAGSAAHPT